MNVDRDPGIAPAHVVKGPAAGIRASRVYRAGTPGISPAARFRRGQGGA
ncbi:MAG: hypothetical protein GX882_03855 [Methanomicrobiales archaeon]|nr:hypothetical protein [Methanomicrobiales archaeon]